MRESTQLPRTMQFSALNVDDMIRITTELNALLSTENDLLRRMHIRDLGPIQAEKQKLGAKLEAFQRHLASDANALKAINEESREKMLILADDLAIKAEDNLQRTVIAQQVNQRVLKTIIDSITERDRLHVYGEHGKDTAGTGPTVSINLNQHA
jgi:hypothetical protein